MIRRAVRRTLAGRIGHVDVAVVNAARMRREHRRWRGDSSVTDVLTFDLRDASEAERVEAQVLVCRDVARREARRRGSDWRRELVLYVVHGCLHLRGYRDHRRSDAAAMHREEDRILAAMGLGPVYSQEVRAVHRGSSRAARNRRA
jgi:probable rRNA maturation factor